MFLINNNDNDYLIIICATVSTGLTCNMHHYILHWFGPSRMAQKVMLCNSYISNMAASFPASRFEERNRGAVKEIVDLFKQG